LVTYLEKNHASRPYLQLLLAVTAIAGDPVTKNPARLAESGPWWKMAHIATTGDTPTETPGPGAEPACDRVGHEHELARHCRACAAERHADTEASTPTLVAVPPPPAIVQLANRHRAKVGTGVSSARDFAQTQELREPDPFNVSRCARPGCGGYYVADTDGVTAHKAVFGHEPEVRSGQEGPELDGEANR
jgi:hypothetical protein